jgi:hypothetical protein
MMSENIARNIYSSQGIINFPTQLHRVGHFRILYHDARKHEYQSSRSWFRASSIINLNKNQPDAHLF